MWVLNYELRYVICVSGLCFPSTAGVTLARTNAHSGPVLTASFNTIFSIVSTWKVPKEQKAKLRWTGTDLTQERLWVDFFFFFKRFRSESLHYWRASSPKVKLKNRLRMPTLGIKLVIGDKPHPGASVTFSAVSDIHRRATPNRRRRGGGERSRCSLTSSVGPRGVEHGATTIPARLKERTRTRCITARRHTAARLHLLVWLTRERKAHQQKRCDTPPPP